MAKTKAQVQPGMQTPMQLISMRVPRYDGSLPQVIPTGGSYATYRAMRKDPTISLARTAMGAIVLAGNWSLEADDDVNNEVVAEVQSWLMPLRETIVGNAVYGGIDFGWAPFEVIWAYESGKDGVGRIIPAVKPLLQDMT